MSEVNLGGRPSIAPTDEQIEKIGQSVRKYMAIGLCASALRIVPRTAMRWMEQGYEDAEKGLVTQYSRFCLAVRENQAIRGQELLDRVAECPKNWQALTWILQNCLREEFGSDAKEYKELLEAFKKLMEDVGRLKQSTQGVVNNG
jgi:hypothetical protein